MSSLKTIKAQLQHLLERANATTGKNDTDLTIACESLIAGYGQGSGDQEVIDGHLGEKLYSFAALSDIHITSGTTGTGAERYEIALSLFNSLGVDMICISGDISDTSNSDELDSFVSLNNVYPNIQVYACTGNHDTEVTDSIWETKLGYPRNHEVIYNNDVFLFLSLPYTYPASAPYGDGLTWLSDRLNRYKGSRIFLFMHFPPSGYSGLVEGQYYGFPSTDTQDDELVTLLNTTKNVTVFTGHTHYEFNVQDTSNDINVYRFNASDVNLVHVPSGKKIRNANFNSKEEAEGWLVNVYEKGFVLQGYNILTGEQVENTEYLFATDNTVTLTNAAIVDTVDVTLTGGESTTVNVSLYEPANITLNVSANNSLITVSPSTLTFTENNYNIPQTVTITAASTIPNTTGCLVTYSGEGLYTKTTSVTLATATATSAIIAPNSSWYTSTTSRSTITEINIVDSVASVPSTYSESWDASKDGDSSVTAYINGTKLYIAGNGSGRIATTDDAGSMFSDDTDSDYFEKLTAINGLNLLDTSAATKMNGMFKKCIAITSLDLSSFNTANVYNMTEMFIDCKALVNLNVSGFNTSKLKYAPNMFWDCTALLTLDLSSFNTPKLEWAQYMFYGCTSLKSLNISNFITSKVTNFEAMFRGCNALESLDVSHFVTTSATTMSGMFRGCETLTTLNLSNFNTSTVTNMSQMFMDCVDLTSLNVSNFNTALVTNMSEMFDHCDNLTTLDISSFDTSAITTTDGLYRFARKSGITDITVGANFVQDYNMYPAGTSGMFYSSSSLPLRIKGANSVLRTYDFATDKRTVTFVA